MNKNDFDNLEELLPKCAAYSDIPKINTNRIERKPLERRKALKRRGTNEEIDIPQIEETIELPMLIVTPEKEETLPVPTIEETVELPLFKSIHTIPEDKEPDSIVVEAKDVKPKGHKSLLRKYVSCASFVALLILTVFCAYKIVLWNKENVKVKEELSLIHDLIEEKKVEPTKKEETPKPIGNQTEETLPTNESEREETPTVESPKYEEKEVNSEKGGIPFVDVDITKLTPLNPDTKAYIKIDNLDVNAPVVQTTDNTYYLSHSFDKRTTSAGWIFGDYRNDWDNLNDNTIIYGHNRRNYAMFGSLKKMYNRDWYENKSNHLIYISTEKKNMIFEIFSIYNIETETYYLKNNFSSQDAKRSFLETIKSRSKLPFDKIPTADDKILTLSTCYTNNQKTVVHAVLIQSEDKH